MTAEVVTITYYKDGKTYGPTDPETNDDVPSTYDYVVVTSVDNGRTTKSIREEPPSIAASYEQMACSGRQIQHATSPTIVSVYPVLVSTTTQKEIYCSGSYGGGTTCQK